MYQTNTQTSTRAHIYHIYNIHVYSFRFGPIQNDAMNVELEIDIDYKACDEKKKKKKKK